MTLRSLPSVDALVRRLGESIPAGLRTEIARSAIEQARKGMKAGEVVEAEAIALKAVRRIEQARHRSVINATGVLLHTNLGRAPLDPIAAESAARAAVSYTNLELDLDDGKRGRRGGYVEQLLQLTTGAEAALVVNNNAAALFLVLVALGSPSPVPVSRGELIEIGGSYRLPDLMAATGCRLVEIGTTNRTRISDYAKAIDSETRLLLKVHPSNYRVSGFAEQPDLSELVALGRDRGLLTVFDIGSGLLDARVPWLVGPPPRWLAGEPAVRQSLESGADLVLFSGDKLLGGPQAGIIVGRADLVARLSANPIARALRVDGSTLSALSSTLESYAGGTAGRLPFWTMATLGFEELEGRCRAVAAELGLDILATTSTVGAGSVPGAEVDSPAIAIRGAVDDNYLKLLHGDPPVVGRREGGKLLLDLRTVLPEQDEELRRSLVDLCR